MVLTQATLAALRTIFSDLFQSGYSQAPVFWDKIATEVPSSSRSNTYGWMDVLPKLREWVGPRLYNNLKERAQVVLNRDFESSVKIDRNDIEDDNLGIYKQAIPMLGRAAKKWPDQLLRDLIEAGDTTTCFDGQFFFDTDHPVNINDAGFGVQSNFFAGSPLTAANFQTVLAAMLSMKGADGEPIGAFMDPANAYLVVPPALLKTADEIVTVRTISTGGENPLFNRAKVLPIPELTSTSTWYLLDVSMPMRPFGFQIRKAPTIETLLDPRDINVFEDRMYKYGVDARGEAFYGLYWFAAQANA